MNKKNHPKIHVAVLWMLKYDGSGFLTGGLERWCRDFALLARDKGYEVHIYQKASRAFEEKLYDTIHVHGIPSSLRFWGNWTLSSWLTKNIPNDEPMVFVSQELAVCGNFKRSIAVNHGIWWDSDFPFLKKVFNKCLQAKLIKKVSAVIAVDTNFINWCHAEIPGRRHWQSKMRYIPNYADLKLFAPEATNRTVHTKSGFRILFPRRLMGTNLAEHPRGVGLLLDAVQILRSEGYKPFVEFAGRGELQGPTRDFAERNGWGDQIQIHELNFESMPEAYQRADVVVVPTLSHEGTSLSAIEAMACGKPVVVTHIGGLGNIVIPGLNGYIADLTPRSLADAIVKAVESAPLQNPDLLTATRNSLGISRWRESVWAVVEGVLK